MLPDGQGIDYLKSLRQTQKSLPVIMLTARAELIDKIVGLESGANDYIEDKKRGCFKSKRYSNNHNFVYEKVFKITKIPFLQKREKKSQEKK